MTKFTILLASIFLVSCDSQNHFKLPAGEIELSLRNGSEVNFSCNIPTDSYLFKNIQNWFNNNQTNWHKSPASYLPDKVIIGHEFKAQVLKTSIVINDLWVHDINKKFYESIKCL